MSPEFAVLVANNWAVEPETMTELLLALEAYPMKRQLFARFVVMTKDPELVILRVLPAFVLVFPT